MNKKWQRRVIQAEECQEENKKKTKRQGENPGYIDENFESRSFSYLQHPFPKADKISSVRKLLGEVILYIWNSPQIKKQHTDTELAEEITDWLKFQTLIKKLFIWLYLY